MKTYKAWAVVNKKGNSVSKNYGQYLIYSCKKLAQGIMFSDEKIVPVKITIKELEVG